MSKQRTLSYTLAARSTSDGAGVKIQRVSGFNIKRFSPFLMIDELWSEENQDYVGGFPAHPHRGIETFSYMLKGNFQHRDSLGNSGELRSGGAQWMASGNGIIHSEMPMMDKGQLHGFQIWINQPSYEKKTRARYADFQPEMVTRLELPELGTARILAGKSTLNGISVDSALNKTGVPVNIIDWRANHNQQLETLLDEAFNAMIYVYKGAIEISGKTISEGQLGFLSQGDKVSLTALQNSGALILAGQPIDEPIVHYGPFFMNSIDEINQAINDYKQGLFESYM